MQEETKVKIDTLPEKKPKKKEAILKDIPKIETLEPEIKTSFIKVEPQYQFIADVIIFMGGIYGFILLCYFLFSFLSKILVDLAAFLIPC